MSRAAQYAENSLANADEMVHEHLPLVKRIAHHIVARLPAHIEVDDLIQIGLIGLLEAAKHYNASLGASFQTYAGIRIRGSIMDELRRTDWVPRTVQQKARRLATATREVENQVKRPARDTEIAAQLAVDLQTYHDMIRETAVCRAIYFDADELESNGDADPQRALENGDFKAALARTIDELPEREKLVMSLYYDDELNLKEIGLVLGVSESRVSQIHSNVVARLRAQLGSWTDAGHADKALGEID